MSQALTVRAAQNTGEEHMKDSLPEQTKGVCHNIECHAQYINRGRYTKGGWSLLGNSLGISQWAIVLCISCFSCGLLFPSSPYHYYYCFISSIIVLLVLLYFVLIMKLFLSQPKRFAFSFWFASTHWGVCLLWRQMNICVVLSYQLG